LVSSIGLYAVLTWFATSRLRELAIRVCLGASSGSIRRIIYGRAVACAGLGVLLSAPLWPLLARLSSVEYLGAVSWSMGRAVAISAACVAVSIAIAHLAAREAALLSPAQLLREE
jgi:ABC-type antimicrobial peptide transport system permease subunit